MDRSPPYFHTRANVPLHLRQQQPRPAPHTLPIENLDESVKVYDFKKRFNEADELGIVKMMFDMGYYVYWNDHAAE